MNHSRFLHHEPCPSCGSSDAFGVYDDGHKYCFSCKHYVASNTFSRSSVRKGAVHNNNNNEPALTLPSDFTTTDIPEEGMKWLTSYLTIGEILSNGFGWSQQGFKIATRTQHLIQYAPLLVMPIWDIYQNLLMWQARYFGSEKRCPKYWTKGNRGCFHILGPHTDTITLVEDLVSAIKLSRFASVMPVFGSEVSNEVAVHLADRYQNLNIWLDKDKRDYANKRVQSLKLLFTNVRAITTECDPKDCSNDEIRERIR